MQKTQSRPARVMVAVVLGYERSGVNALRCAVTLGSNADLTSLTEARQRRTEAILSRVAQQAALVSRKLPLGYSKGSEVA